MKDSTSMLRKILQSTRSTCKCHNFCKYLQRIIFNGTRTSGLIQGNKLALGIFEFHQHKSDPKIRSRLKLEGSLHFQEQLKLTDCC